LGLTALRVHVDHRWQRDDLRRGVVKRHEPISVDHSMVACDERLVWCHQTERRDPAGKFDRPRRYPRETSSKARLTIAPGLCAMTEPAAQVAPPSSVLSTASAWLSGARRTAKPVVRSGANAIAAGSQSSSLSALVTSTRQR